MPRIFFHYLGDHAGAWLKESGAIAAVRPDVYAWGGGTVIVSPDDTGLHIVACVGRENDHLLELNDQAALEFREGLNAAIAQIAEQYGVALDPND